MKYALILGAFLGGLGMNTAFAKTDNYTYVITETAMSTSLDPLDADQTQNLPVARMLYATPIEIDTHDKISSLVLESYRYEQKENSIDWTIKKDAKYSDGTAITAEDVAFSVSRMAFTRPKFPVLEHIDGLTDWLSQKTPLETLPKGIVLDGNKISIRLAKSVKHPLFRFTLEIFSIIPKKCVDLKTNKLSCDRVPSSGRYQLASRNESEILFNKRTDILETIPESIKFKYIPAMKVSRELQSLDSKTIVAGNEVMYSFDTISTLKGMGNISFLPAARFAILQLNPNFGAFNDKNCRRVFADTFRKNFKKVTNEQSLSESSIFTKIVTGYLPATTLSEKEPKISTKERTECVRKIASSEFRWGYIETEKNPNFVATLTETLKELGVKNIELKLFKNRKEVSEEFLENKLALLGGGSGFWALDPSGDLQMLFTPNLHKTLSSIANDDALQGLIKNVRDDSENKRSYWAVNQYLYNDGKFNIYSHVRRFYFSKDKDLLKRTQLGIFSAYSLAGVSMMNSLETLTHLNSVLGKSDFLPKHMDIAQVGNIHMANVYDEVDSPIISNTIMTGFDPDLYTAILKSFSEYFERKAFDEGYVGKNPYCQTERSDGFAAFPKTDIVFALRARENALNEAIERFVWATWWDNPNINAIISSPTASDGHFWKDSIALIREIEDLFSIKNIKIVEPQFSSFPDKELLIIFFEIEGGVISGGACGDRKDRDQTILKAMSELARHALALHKIKAKNLVPCSFYERRLHFFGTKIGYSHYLNRLEINGQKKVALPALSIDHEIEHSFSEHFYVHRCLFENQPPFIGGYLERLCL